MSTVIDERVPSEYLRFEKRVEDQTSKITQHWRVMSKDGTTLGRIKWYAQWRQYTFFPRALTTWNPTCLAEVGNMCALLTVEHKRKLAERRLTT